MIWNIAKRGLAVLLSAHLLLDPMIANAGGVTPDTAAPVANRPSMDSAANGVPLVNIVAPNASGLSHNKFTDFNVGANGLILNNSQSAGVSKLGGVVLGNPNLTGGTARSILADVTGGNLSLLQGVTEVFGTSADFILANPAGITCQGCGFINTPRVTLSTGTPALDGNGGLTGLDVAQGAVLVDGQTLDVTGLDIFDIVSRTARLNAAIKGQTLGIFTGAGHYDYAARTTTASGAGGSGVSIDSSALGGLYANRITLIGTDKGVGVNLQGEVNAADALVISADGQVEARLMKSGGATSLTSANGTVAIDDTAYAGSSLSLKGTGVTVSGLAAAAGDVTVQSGSFTNNGQVAAGVASDGTVSAGTGTLSVTASGQAANGGTLMSGKATQVTAGSLSNDGTIQSLGSVAVAAQQFTNQGALAAGGDAAIQANSLNNSGQLLAGIASDGTMSAGAGTLSVTAGQMSNSGILHSGKATAITAGSLGNAAAGSIESLGNVGVAARQLTNQGALAAGNTLGLTAGNLDNAGTLSAGGALSAGTLGNLTNEASGRVVASGTVTLNAGLGDPSGSLRQSGQLAGGGAVTLTGPTVILAAGSLTAASTTLSLAAEDLTLGGRAQAGSDLTTVSLGASTGATHVLATGTAVAGGQLSMTAATTLDMAGALSGQDVSLGAGTGLTIAAGGTTTATLAIGLSGATVANSGVVDTQTLTVTAGQSITNNAGGSLTGRTSLGVTGDSLENDGAMFAGTSLAVTLGGSLANSGTMGSAGDANLQAGGAGNSGTIATEGKLTATVASLINSGKFSAGATLGLTTTGKLTNSGTLVSTGDMTLTAGDTINSSKIVSNGGTVSATLASLDNQASGSISGNSGLKLTLAGNLGNEGLLVSGGDFLLKAGDPTNNGTISSAGLLTLNMADLTNYGSISGGTGLVVPLTGGLINYGSMVSGGGASLTAANLYNGGTISGATGLSLTIAGDLNNANQIMTNGVLTASSASLENSGTISGSTSVSLTVGGGLSNSGDLLSGGALTLSGLSSLDNSGLMQSVGDMAVSASGNVNNWSGALVAGGNLWITGPGGGSAAAILNQGGSLETVNGDMWLSAGTVTNQALGTVTPGTNQIVYDKTSSADHSVPLGSCTMGAACKGEYWSSWTWVPNPTGTDAGAWYGSSTGLTIRSWVVENAPVFTGTQASISSGHALQIAAAGGITNSYGTISSTGDMVLTGGSLTNVGAQATRSWYVESWNSTDTRCFGGKCNWFQDGGHGTGTQLYSTWISGQQGGQIKAGGSLTGSFTGQINNISVIANTSVSGTAAASPGLLSASAVSGFAASQVSLGAPGGYSGQINLVTGLPVDGKSLIPQAGFPSPLLP
jgi:filamentous hemagglutinin